MVQLNSSADSRSDPVVYPKANKVILNTFDDEDSYKVQIHRKPKTTNFDDLEDESQPQKDKFLENNDFQAGLGESFETNKEIKKHGKTKKLTDNDNKVFHEGDFNNEPNYSDENLKNSKEIEETENIDDDYEDDEEYEEENSNEEENDEYDYDDTNDDKPNFRQNNEQFKYKTNPVFKPGDFGDIRGLEYYRKPKLKVQEQQEHPKPKLRATEEPSSVENGIYWSAYVESLIPKGLSYTNVTKVIRAIRSTPVRSLEAPKWNRCGRVKNTYVTLIDDSHLCARYRHPHSFFVFGEVLSFYLSRLIGLDNVPVVVLATTNSSSPQWKATDFSKFEWENNVTIALIQWINGIEDNFSSSSKAFMPSLILRAYKTGEPIRAEDINKSVHQSNSYTHIPEIAQWGTMIIFDYLTGNYDRVASMQDAADKEQKPSIIEEQIRNLRKSSKDGKLWLVDNESGLFDAYDLINKKYDPVTSRFTAFHDQMLQTTCIFQASVIRALEKLYRSPSPHERLINYALSFEPLIQQLPKDIHYKRFTQMFVMRIENVLNWVKKCKSYSYEDR